MNLAEFVTKFEEIKAMGWVKSMRRGNTGIGYTLEELLGISENNISAPDLGNIELKAHRINSTSMITLFTFNRKAWKMNPLEAIKKYGTPDGNGRLGMYFTMSQKPNRSGLFLHIEDDSILLRHVSGKVIAEWKLAFLAENFMQKTPAMIFVSAFSEKHGESEWFNFDRAQIFQGTSAAIIGGQFLAGNVFFELWLDEEKDIVNFLVQENKLSLLFKNIKDV